MKSRLFMTLFALPFFGVGVFMLYLVLSTFHDAYRMGNWVPTPATLEAAGYETHRGDDSDTYEVYATYRYTVNGQVFIGHRVALSSGGDNIGSYQQAMGNALSGKLARGEPITVLVNPDDPNDAIIDPSPRWGLVAFHSIFVFVFGGVGLGLLIATWRAPKPKDRAEPRYSEAPWLLNDDWQTEQVRSSSRATMWGAWMFAGLWNAISMPLPFLAWDEIVSENNIVALVAFLFPAVGLGLLTWAVRRTLEWRRFGRTPVTLDPFPGAIGGHVGGSIELPVPYSSATAYRVTLTSIHSYVSGSGKNRSRRENALWQDEVFAHTESAMKGTRVTFRFDVPEGLQESDADPDSDSYNLWRLSVQAKLPGADLDRDYEIPVYRTGATARRISDRQLAAAASISDSANEDAVREVVRISNRGMGKQLRYPMGRNFVPSAMGFTIGAVFAAIGWFIAVDEGQAIFGTIFGGIGAIVAVLTFYSMFKSLEVSREGNTIRSVRRLLGIPISRKSMNINSVYRLEKDRGMSTQSGGKHTVYYRITAIDRDANEVLLGEGFRGESGAAAAEAFLRRELGIA